MKTTGLFSGSAREVVVAGRVVGVETLILAGGKVVGRAVLLAADAVVDLLAEKAKDAAAITVEVTAC